jgi:exodeoxyribonuclease V alpha subunit
MKESLQKYSEGIEDTVLKEKMQKIRSKTLHSLLGISKYNVSNSSSAAKKLPFDVLIVDESSMIDISLMSKLFSSIKTETRLILLGDRFQLSSIGAGSVFGDLCFSVQMNRFSAKDIDFINSLTERDFLTEAELGDPGQHNPLTSKVIELKKSYRFSDDKGIGKISKLILEGTENGLNEFYNIGNPDHEVMIADDIENDFSERLLMLYDEYAAEDDISEAFVKLNRIRILCSVTSGKYSTDYFNKLIETRLLEKRLLNPGSYFYDKQPIIINENDYNLGLFNGDTGIVRFERETGFYNAFFQLQELKKVPCNQIKKFSTAYAMSIHKSQGSEFENVLVVLNSAGKEKFVSRELLYTAVTRAKNRIMIISEREVLEKAMKNKVSRISGIKYRLNKPASIS